MSFDFPKQVARQFSQSANFYHQNANVQRRIAEKVAEMLPAEIASDRVLDLGCGSGFLTALCLQKYPGKKIIGLDCSKQMIERAKEFLPSSERLKFEQADLFEYSPTEEYSLVVSSSVFHWVTDLEMLFLKIRTFLSSNGRVVFAAMTSGTFAELQAARGVVAPKKISRHRLPSSTEFVTALGSAGFSLLRFEQESYPVSFSDSMQFLRDVHDLGFNAGQGLLSRGELCRLTELYDAQYVGATGGVYATYEVCFAEAQR